MKKGTETDTPFAVTASRSAAPSATTATEVTSVESRAISESSAERHRDQLRELSLKVWRIVAKTGISEVWSDNPHLTFEEMFEQIYKRKRSSSVINDIIVSFNEVYRSAMTALSPREDIIDVVLTISPALMFIAESFEQYATLRPQEVKSEACMALMCSATDMHTTERDQFIATELRGCSADLTAVTTRLMALAEALGTERVDAVRANVYSDTGGGCRAEMAMRTGDRGIEPDRLAVLFRSVDEPPKNCRGFRRKATMRERLKTAGRRVLAQANRTREAMSPQVQEN